MQTLEQNNATKSYPRSAGSFFSPVQAKLTVNQPNDVYEQEADSMADKVMRMPDNALGKSFFSPANAFVQRKCAQCEEEEKEVQRKCEHCGADVGTEMVQRKCDHCGADAGTEIVQRKCEHCGEEEAPAVQRKCAHCEEEETVQRQHDEAIQRNEDYIHSLNSAGGQSLTAEERSFYEPRFGRDFSSVKVHTGPQADASARSIQAKAYTHGNNIVFASRHYEPGTDAGKRLMAHELTHVVQQQPDMVQRSCLTGAACTAPICGSPGSFSTQEEAIEAPLRAARTTQIITAPAAARASGHSRRATNAEAVLTAAGLNLGAVNGIFVDLDMSPGTGAFTTPCHSFTTWTTPFAGPAGSECIFIPNQDELDATTFQTTVQPMISGVPRARWLMDFKTMITHEIQHVLYDNVARPALPGVTCTRSTVIDGHTVSFFLSELSAEISEFPPLFEFIRRRSPDYATMMTNLQTEYSNTVNNCSESIRGILTGLRCNCPCADVTAYLEETIAFTVSGWTTTQKNVFRELMLFNFPGLNWTRRRF